MLHDTVIVMLPDKVVPFKVIIDRVVSSTGSLNKAAVALGVSNQTLTKCLRSDYLTDRSARVILAAFKQIKRDIT